MENYSQTKERTFRDIVLSAEEKILEILAKELRLYKKIVTFGSGNRSDLVVEEEDTRESFVQAVQGLALILQPYFDEDMKKAYGDFDEMVDMISSEFLCNYREMITKTMKLHNNTFENEDDDKRVDRTQVDSIHLKHKVRTAKIIFRELNKLLKRQDYLKNAIYGDSESDDEVVEDDKDGDE